MLVIIKSDSKKVGDLSCNRKGRKSEIFWMIETIWANLKSLNGFKIQHVPRPCNVTARSLAKIALNYDAPALWLETFPAEIMVFFWSWSIESCTFAYKKRKKEKKSDDLLLSSSQKLLFPNKLGRQKHDVESNVRNSAGLVK